MKLEEDNFSLLLSIVGNYITITKSIGYSGDGLNSTNR
jgi:hypothetical protein